MAFDHLPLSMKNGSSGRPNGLHDTVGTALRQRREAAGMSLGALARSIHYSKGYLSKVETGRARCTQALADLCDMVLGAGGELSALVEAGGGAPARRRPSAATWVQRSAVSCGMTFLFALNTAHIGLREVARTVPADSDRRRELADGAVHRAKIYPARERLLVYGTLRMVTRGEEVFQRLIAVRDAVRTGANLESPEYHGPYHRFAEGLWLFRLAVRTEIGQPPFFPESLNRVDWLDRERCRDCVDTG